MAVWYLLLVIGNPWHGVAYGPLPMTETACVRAEQSLNDNIGKAKCINWETGEVK
jgi:hypothetical protein